MARTRFSLATCNLYNLNLPGLPMYRDASGWTRAEYDAKLGWMAQALVHVNADVWGFQELWHAQALAEVFERAGLAGDYELLAPAGHAGGKIVCAGAVRKDMLAAEPEWIERFPPKFVLRDSGSDEQSPQVSVNIKGFSRPVLHFRVRPTPDVEAVHVFVAHLKSKQEAPVHTERWYRADKTFYARHAKGLGAALSTIRRTAEAAALRMLLTDLTRGSDAPVVLMGDLNDGQRSNTQDIITGGPNYLLSGLSRGGGDTVLYATELLQNYRSLRDVYYSYIHENQHESLDHILVSQEFYDNSRKRVWAFEGLEVFNDHLNFAEHKHNGTPDHGIVKATFTHLPA